MGRRTELREHTLQDTCNVILDERVISAVKRIIEEHTGQLMEIHIVQGEDVKYKQCEDIWSSGL